DLAPELDDQGAGIVDPEAERVLDSVAFEGLVERSQEVVAALDQLPLVGVGHGDAPALVKRLETLERPAGEVVHDNEHRAGGPVIRDVARADAVEDGCRAVGPHDGTTEPAPRLLEAMALGPEDGLAHDPDDDLVAVRRQAADSARGAERAEDPEGERV